jgi:hypothetical protein
MNIYEMILCFYLTGVLIMMGYSVQLYLYTRKYILVYIRLIILSWYSIGSIAGTLLVQKRQYETSVINAQRIIDERKKHEKNKPHLIIPS